MKLTDEARWAAVEARDAGCADPFVYGVRTTGIYARPGSPARTPRRKNVQFFDTADAAEAAGYRRSRSNGDTGRGADPVPTGRHAPLACHRNGGSGHGGSSIDIRFAVGQCSLGAILVARSPRGVCAILLGDDAAALVRDLQDRFPHANLIGGDAGFERLVAQVVGLVESPTLGTRLPLDIRGTAFQERVWRALCEIPPGVTISYSELARRIGAPSAVRAVAGACAANRIAVAIPCHRVVRTDGSLSGYRWGIERKRALIDRERSG